MICDVRFDMPSADTTSFILKHSDLHCVNTREVFVHLLLSQSKVFSNYCQEVFKNVNFNTLHLLQNQSNMSWLHEQEEVMEKYWRIFGCKPVQIYKSKENVSHIWTVLIQHI